MLTIREVIKTFYNALLQRLKKHRGNWEQNDPTADDYIKNRPFYTDENNVVVKLDKKYLPNLGLAPVAKSGNYDDLVNRPTVYSDVVRYGASQSLSTSQKNVARNNIGAAAASDVTGVVKYTSQSLSDAQKQQARTNIGAGTSSFSGSYNDLTNKPNVVQYSTQTLTDSQKQQARKNIGAGTSSFSGSYNDLTNKPSPNCTTDNNGQFLRVVDGVATWSTIPNAEGVSF